MLPKRAAALLLALTGLLGLSGCARMFEKEYRVSAPYVEPQTEGETTGAEITSYAALTRALRGMVADYATQGTLVFADYDGIISDDMAKACWELRSSTALGAYCVQDISFEIEQVVAYCEADVVITYKRSAEDVKNIYSAQSIAAVEQSIVSAMEADRRRFAIQMNSGELDEGDVQEALERIALEHPLLTVSFPEAEITMFTGETRQRIFEVQVEYPISNAVLSERRTAVAKAASALAASAGRSAEGAVYAACDAVGRACESPGSDCTAYDVLVEHRGDSRALAMALKAVCDELEIPCEIVSGQLDSFLHTWNIIELDGERYHVDLTGYAGTLWFQPDNVIWGRYWWNTDAHAPCTAESIIWTAA